MKMYKKPTTDVMDIKTESLMQSITVSTRTPENPGAPPPVGMPKRGSVIP
jgi:hypothetical protein